MTLITKLHYSGYEPGEFTDKKERTYEETTALIEKFPWQEQKEHTAIGIASPGIVMEDGLGEYLKLAPYYNGKFQLFYLDAGSHLYTRSFPDYQGAFPFIQAFFEHRTDSEGFQLERFWMQGKSIHFKDNDFRYTPKKVGILLSMLALGAYCAIVMVMSWVLLFKASLNLPLSLLLTAVFWGCIALMGGKLILLINYYRVARNKMLILSKGNDIFYYGPINNPKRFDKKDIQEIVTYGTNGSKRMEIDGFFRIELRSGDQVYIPYMVLHRDELLAKLSGYPHRHESGWYPFIPLSASAPS